MATRFELPDGITVGHWTEGDARTGCTVVLAEAGAVAGVDVRGGAPGTLGTDALRPGTVVDRTHAVLLTGRSTFGLAAADGVMRYLEERGIGFALGDVRIPVVAGAVIFDLFVGDRRVRPDAAAGYAACRAAGRTPEIGAVGVGTAATVAKAAGGAQARPGGLGIASARVGDAVVAAVIVANSVGGIWDDVRHEWIAPLTTWDRSSPLFPGGNTTIGAIVTDAKLTTDQANRLATVGHDGIARAVRPAHTMFDGDTLFSLATCVHAAPYDAIEAVATDVVAAARTPAAIAAQQR
ncbi:MAG TPA: P1 family peptidase [Kofleriaceae bacterium]|nr:P1 family peptidase [Kofleriaceae bacterium]